ncbi:MAG TPA: hypothetical protein VIE66_07320 [Methylocella sp.]|jgi:hypothetical protein
MNTEAIRFVAKAILAQDTVLPNGERLEFDMTNWCGTACCIAGWTNFLITDDENARKDEHDLFSAERKLGLTRNEALELFSPALTVPYSEVTPQQAAEVLLRLADTGAVDWEKLKNPLGPLGVKAEEYPAFPRGTPKFARR